MVVASLLPAPWQPRAIRALRSIYHHRRVTENEKMNEFLCRFTGGFSATLHPGPVDLDKAADTQPELSHDRQAQTGGGRVQDLQRVQEQHGRHRSQLDRDQRELSMNR